MEMFEKAVRLKLRFDTPLGSLPVEDVWDLPLLPGRGKNGGRKGGKACLDDLAKVLHKELQSDDSESFVLKRKRTNDELQLRFDIVKHVIDVRLEEKERAENVAKAKEKKQQILAIISDKETEDLKGKSLEDLRALCDTL